MINVWELNKNAMYTRYVIGSRNEGLVSFSFITHMQKYFCQTKIPPAPK